MPTYKLTYFNIRGLAEPIRYILSYGGQNFEDERFTHEEWPEKKNSMPFGKVPVLEIDGKQVTQSAAICRHLARQFNLVGSNDWDSFQIDITVDTIKDFKEELKALSSIKDEELKNQKRVAMMSETVPFYMSRFDKQIQDNKGFFVNGQLTWVDLYATALFGCMAGVLGASFLDSYPNLLALSKKVKSLPAIKAWIEKKPKTEG